MRYRKLTANNDYTFGNGQLDFYRDVPEAVAQAVKTRLLLWLGEWFLDINEGTPYMQGILGKYSKATADITIQDRVLSTPKVVGITNYLSILDASTRSLSVSFDLDTIYGPTKVQVSNYANY
jgi:hypothetical protein